MTSEQSAKLETGVDRELPIARLLCEWWQKPMPWTKGIELKDSAQRVADDLIRYLDYHGYMVISAAEHDRDLERLERAADSLDKYRNITERAGRAIDQAATEIEALWHYSTCPYDHCERCIREEDIIKCVRDRLAEQAIANSQFGVGA